MKNTITCNFCTTGQREICPRVLVSGRCFSAEPLQLSVAPPGKYTTQGSDPSYLEALDMHPEPISGCDLCGHPRHSNGMETHSSLCVAFRELKDRFDELETRVTGASK